MKGVGTDIGTIHFVGIGGIGMSGIAEVMNNLGYKVQGSDIAEGYVVEGLRKRGIKVMIGHAAENIGDAAVVVTSTAVKRSSVSQCSRRVSTRPSVIGGQSSQGVKSSSTTMPPSSTRSAIASTLTSSGSPASRKSRE